MRLIKKSEKLIPQNPETSGETDETILTTDTINSQKQTVEEKPEWDTEYPEPNYIPARDNPIVLSVGNTGWQVSDIWKDIRLDNF